MQTLQKAHVQCEPRKETVRGLKLKKAKVTMKHFLMLRYWHRMAHQELKDHYRLPEVGETFDGLCRRDLSAFDLETIERCFRELREALSKIQVSEIMALCH